MRCTKPQVGRALLVSAGGLALTLVLTATAAATPRMWGIDGQDAYLFSIEDYRHPIGTFTPRGPLHWDDAGTIRPLANTWHGRAVVQSFVLDRTDTAYLMINRDLRPDLRGPVLVSLDLTRSQPGGDQAPPIVRVVGSLHFPDAWGHSRVTGLAINLQHDRARPRGDRRLYATVQTQAGLSQLIAIDKHTARPLPGGGPLTGRGYHLLEAEDLAFDRNGFLYVTDAVHGRLFRVSPITGEVIAPIAGDPQSPAGEVSAMRFEPITGVMVGFHANTGQLVMKQPVAGDLVLAETAITPQLLGVQGMDFQPTPPTTPPIRWDQTFGSGGIGGLWAAAPATPGMHAGVPAALGGSRLGDIGQGGSNTLTDPNELDMDPDPNDPGHGKDPIVIVDPLDPEGPQSDPNDPHDPDGPDGPGGPGDPPFDPEQGPGDPDGPGGPGGPYDPPAPPPGGNESVPTSPVPEPTPLVLLLLAGVALLAWCTRRRGVCGATR